VTDSEGDNGDTFGLSAFCGWFDPDLVFVKYSTSYAMKLTGQNLI